MKLLTWISPLFLHQSETNRQNRYHSRVTSPLFPVYFTFHKNSSFLPADLSLNLFLDLTEVYTPRLTLLRPSYAEKQIGTGEMEIQNGIQNGDFNNLPDRHESSLIFLGTGCSSAVPNAMCLIKPSSPPCAVCSQSLSIPPERNPNYRYLVLFRKKKICLRCKLAADCRCLGLIEARSASLSGLVDVYLVCFGFDLVY